jgi:hypothetical protein
MLSISSLRNFLLLILTGIAGPSLAQNSEIGVGIGGLNYTGDLSPNYRIQNIRPGITAFYRSNVSQVVSVRVGATFGWLYGTDAFGYDSFTQSRDSSFNAIGSSSTFKISLFEASTVAEYHFLNWRSDRRPVKWTPYLFGGFAIFGFSGHPERSTEYSNVQLALPFGAGVKYVLNPKWYVGAEFGARKTFFDYLDNISGPLSPDKNYRHGNASTHDAYYFLSFTLTYSFYTIPCPKSPY